MSLLLLESGDALLLEDGGRLLLEEAAAVAETSPYAYGASAFDASPLVAPPPPGPADSFDGADVLEAIAAWWAANAQVQLIASDKNLWHGEAKIGTVLPYSTFFLVSEGPEAWTTAYAIMKATVQVNCHAATDQSAREAARTIRDSLRDAPLSIAGERVMSVLPDRSGMELSKDVGPEGQDVWIAYQTFDVMWTE